jgi:RNA polymerase sigma-70 factor, ECF subfamily
VQFAEFDAPLQAARVQRVRAGDAAAFGEIYDETFQKVYRYASSLTYSREDAEDLTAETYERALRAISKYSSRDIPIAVWLLRIARNVAHERAQRARKQPRAIVPIESIASTLQGAVPPEPEPDLGPLLGALTPAQHDVITLRLAGLRCREVAELLGKAEGTVKALQFAAVRNMRRSVKR